MCHQVKERFVRLQASNAFATEKRSIKSHVKAMCSLCMSSTAGILELWHLDQSLKYVNLTFNIDGNFCALHKGLLCRAYFLHLRTGINLFSNITLFTTCQEQFAARSFPKGDLIYKTINISILGIKSPFLSTLTVKGLELRVDSSVLMHKPSLRNQSSLIYNSELLHCFY